MTPTRTFLVSAEDAGQRLDLYLAARLPELSRTRIRELIDAGLVRVGGAAARAAQRVRAGQDIRVTPQPRPALEAVPEPLPLDILYQDDDVVVVNKPAGMVVHAGGGAARGTLVNALMHHCGRLSTVGGAVRPGLVHRLDKDTSGALVVARHDAAHRALAAQFRARTVVKEYLVLVHGRLEKDAGSIELPVARDLHRRTRMTTRRAAGRPARTDWRVLLRLGDFTLLRATPHTGRTHQIRVHLSAIGHPVAGDTLYGAPRRLRAGQQILPAPGRNFLHAARICFTHPVKETPVEVRAPLPAGLRALLGGVARACGQSPDAVDARLREFL